ncbi:HlyC/CorC family transporter [Aerococcaceae bacterium zg-ZJ1578]|uniref:hemolysin family protein n=1 Tax=Aerococcaceae TaxID=186827 RepID=UPI0013B82676|nr:MULTISPECIES: hemolysin family protein [unclassified Facklamia]MBK0347317.1 HlyC/CorC family transporter [Aerococcaceae bacterium zg-1578]MBR7927714.1 HlyC/CorC family transporter [Aerococcaceae bacterium zg-ZUI334]MBS4462053.1 HlyC/CorC family transporter [Aerococcaceae bacterium zg-B36]QQD65700.1 HlyC/CorC family transporter [Aerococcaceae bacterium zg-252]NEW64516.1 DUF21 domain-containing protein [Facklamia sp. 252]
MDPSGNSLFNQILIIIVLTAVNAFFAASEMAFVSVNRKRIATLAEEGNKKAVKVLRLLDNSEDFLATIQVAITLAGFLSSAQAATSFASYFKNWLPAFPGVETVAIFIVTMILSYITLVFGELYPKQVALQMPEKITLATAGTIQTIQVVFKPFVSLLSASTGLLRKITPIDFSARDEKFTREEMKAILAESSLEGTIDAAELTMLEGVLSLDSKLAREVMVPRTDTEMVDIEDDYQDILEELLNSPFSRIPLYEAEKDNVIGVIHMKNVIKAAREHGFDNIDFREIASEPLFVPSTIYIDDLLVEFKREQTHLAILRDEYGGVEGIVTLEDLLEEIVGDIEDETDVASSGDIRKIDEENYYINGGLSVEKFNNYFDESLSDEEVDTIAGAIIYEIGYVPDDNERVTVRANDYVMTTSHVENGRIRGVHVQVDKEHTIETEFNLYDDDTKAYVPIKEVLEELAD